MPDRLPVRAAGIPWYRAEDYGRIVAIMQDKERLPATFEQWREAAEKAERGAKAAGVVTVRAVIDPDTFPGWCAAHGLDVDAEARVRFANEAAYAEVRGRH